MLDSAAIGAIIGFLGRAGPEVLKFADRHLDRRHELAMQDKALEFERIPGRAGKISEKAMIDAGQLQDVLALTREAYAQQFNTGSAWLNAISVLVRPTTTAVLVLLYVSVKTATVTSALASGTPFESMLRAYNENDVAILSGLLSFWFASRSIEKGRG